MAASASKLMAMVNGNDVVAPQTINITSAVMGNSKVYSLWRVLIP
jgi:hypothetical protein